METVQDRERWIDARRRDVACSRCAGEAEERCRDRCITVQELGTFELVRVDEDRLEQLPNHAVRERALELRAARVHDAHAATGRRVARSRE